MQYTTQVLRWLTWKRIIEVLCLFYYTLFTYYYYYFERKHLYIPIYMSNHVPSLQDSMKWTLGQSSGIPLLYMDIYMWSAHLSISIQCLLMAELVQGHMTRRQTHTSYETFSCVAYTTLEKEMNENLRKKEGDGRWCKNELKDSCPFIKRVNISVRRLMFYDIF